MSWKTYIKDARSIGRDLSDPDPAELADLLAKGAADSLSVPESNRLFNLLYSPEFPSLRETVLDASRAARRRIFGNKVTVMAPVEVSNRCSSDCLFCGWRASNPDIPRTKITPDLVLEQVKYLLDLGIGYIELVGGDDFQFVREELPGLARSVRGLIQERRMDGQVCVCSMAVTEQHYRDWKGYGVDAMLVWQETYDPDLYKQKILAGPKARGINEQWKLGAIGDGYGFRVSSQERAMRAGVNVGLGFMMGLNPDINYEFLMTIQHVRHLLREFGNDRRRPIVIGMPVWNQITTPRTDKRPSQILDAETVFPFLSAVYFLSLPKGAVWVFPNCRVSLESQLLSIDVAGVFTSTEVKLGPGGYLPATLRALDAKGVDTAALRARVKAEMGFDCNDLEKMSTEIDIGEQFMHHFHPHKVYMDAMAKHGLEVVPYSGLTG
ncbi:MAG TPA: hypothetical protein PLE77_11890 [Kiritimatiellia bacterium]|nr:hypothetical protein [Kiritimatiellia bacterium]